MMFTSLSARRLAWKTGSTVPLVLSCDISHKRQKVRRYRNLGNPDEKSSDEPRIDERSSFHFLLSLSRSSSFTPFYITRIHCFRFAPFKTPQSLTQSLKSLQIMASNMDSVPNNPSEDPPFSNNTLMSKRFSAPHLPASSQGVNAVG
jgi:hypothetical protein